MSRRRRREPVEPVVPPPGAPQWWERPIVFALACVALFALVFFGYARSAWASALYRVLVEAPLLLLWLAAMAGAGNLLLRLFNIRTSATLQIVTSVALGIGVYSLLTLVLGLTGILSRPLAYVLLFAGLAIGIVLLLPLQSQITNRKSQIPPLDPASWLWLLAVPFLAIAVLGACMPPGVLWGPNEPNGYDVLEYHLQIPREWYDAGRIFPLHHNVFSFFPFNVEMHYLLAMHLRGGPWAGMYLAQLMHLAMVVLTVVAVTSFVGKRGRLGVLLVAVTPWLPMLASVAYNEGGLLLFGTLAVGWTCRAIGEPNRMRTMALAGAMAGLACGVKLTAVPMVLLAVPIVFSAALALRRQRWLAPAAAFIVCGGIVFAPWLVRNAAWARNPVFPEAMKLLGRAHFSPDQVERWERAHAVPADKSPIPARLRAAWDQIFVDWRFGYVILPAAALAVLYPLLTGRRHHALSPGTPGERVGVRGSSDLQVASGAPEPQPTAFLPALVAAWFLFWLFFTHLEGRFFVLAVPVLAMIVARVELPIARLALLCGLLLQVGFGMLNFQPPIAQQFIPYRDLIAIDTFPLPDDLADAASTGASVCLIGDATPFRYPLPSARLHYRTVFDVDPRGRPIEDAWADGCPRHPGDLLLLDFNELARFSQTYFAIPPSTTGGQGRVVMRVQK
jgi:hypothetical protein